MSTFIHRKQWDEYDMLRLLALKKIAEMGHDIVFTCKDSDYVQQKENSFQKMHVSSRRDKRTICLDTLEVYDSAGEAGRPLGGTSSQIAAVCRGALKSYKGFRFAYYDDYVAGTIPRYKGRRRKRGNQE